MKTKEQTKLLAELIDKTNKVIVKDNCIPVEYMKLILNQEDLDEHLNLLEEIEDGKQTKSQSW